LGCSPIAPVRTTIRAIIAGAMLSLGATAAHSQNATWLPAPGSSDFDTAANWSPATVPTNTATFGASNTTSLTFSSNATTIGTLQFQAAAPAYTFTVTNALDITGTGIVNNSSGAPIINDFNNSHNFGTFFQNASTAANAIINNTAGYVEFAQTSTAASSTITNTAQGAAFFVNTSTAGNANITTNGANTFTVFSDASMAGNAIMTTGNGGATFFSNSSTADNATVTTNAGGTTAIQNTASGGHAQFITNAGGIFDISGLSSGGTTAGSIAGAGSF
jgi:hypothetical protein